LQQVIWNLVTNAIKFTPAGDQIEVRAERYNSRIEIKVGDTGQGIEPELLPHLFERLWQGENGPNRNRVGLRLGLAIVKHLLELHGGAVMASSPGVGKGAEFTVSSPIRSFEDWLPAPAQPTSAATDEITRLDGVRLKRAA
jgi:signal transduction histidine kinase